MATIFTRDWTAANGTSWSAVGFTRVVGSALDALVGSNAGECGTVAGERVWIATGHAQTPGHNVACDLDWIDAVGSSRAPGVGARWTSDGANGYMAEIDSNTNAARVRLRRRRSGSWSTLTGWTDVSGTITGAALNAGVTCELRTVNEDGQVNLQFTVAGNLLIDYDDTHANRIELAGYPALLMDGNSTGTQVVYDNLTVTDLAAEWSGSGSLSTDTALVVDGVSYSFEDLVAAGVYIGTGRQSYDQGDGWEFTTSDLMDASDSILYPGAVVTVAIDGTVVAFGRIQAASRSLKPGEGRAYRLMSARALAADVVLEHPDTHTNSITWNLPEDHADYEAAYADVEIGEAIKVILDEHADGTTGLRAHLAAPPDEDDPPYVQAELDLLTLKVPAMTVSGDPVTAVEQLLAFTKYVLFIDPATLIWHFKDRTAGTIKQVDLDASHVLGEYRIDPERNVTACVLYGSKPETTTTTVTSSSGLTKGWASALEASRTDENSVRNTDNGLVASISGSVGAPTMTPDTVGPPTFSMAASEWVQCVVTFTSGAESGNSYTVTSNTALAFTLVGPWTAGGPSAGDAFTVSGNAAGGGRDNAYTEIGRRYTLTNTDLGVPEDACVYVKITQGNVEKITAAKVVTTSTGTDVVLDLPAIGLVNFAPDAAPEPCDAGGVSLATVEATFPTYSISDPRTPRLWYPRDGSGNDAYRGSAYTTDDAKWDGAGTPGRGDPGVMRALIQNAPEYTGSAAEDTQWDAVFAEMLSYMGTLARSVTLTIGGVLDTQYAGLGHRLQVLNGPSELETLEDLTILAVEWNVAGNTTTLYAGTFAAGPYDVQRMREASVAVNVKRRQKRETGLLEKVRDCLSTNLHSAGYARDLPPVQVCADRITLPGGGGERLGETLNQECESPAQNCAPSCTTFPCGTVTNPNQFASNSNTLNAMQLSNKDAAAGVAYLASVIACLHRTQGAIASSHDQELHKTYTDLDDVRIALTEIVNCFNSVKDSLCAAITAVDTRVTMLQTCVGNTFATVEPGPGVAFNCTNPPAPCSEPADCEHDFTPHVCDPVACAVTVPTLDAFTGCVEP